jgi:hypothetical protein
MAVRVNINGITGGTEPYDVYVCQPNNTSCFYISTIMDSYLNPNPYEFDIPAPYDNSQAYLIKLVDSNDCIISGTSRV